MIDEYIDEQKIITTVLKNAVEKNKISHAYLFETNGYQNKDDFVLAFIKYLLCPHNYSNNKNCVNCTQCELIQKRIFSEVKHIYPDGMWIKKEQLEELQQNFSETSVESNKRIYVIHNADRLNTASANSILKFLEEPVDDIIAILIVDNINLVLPTILSRCQIIKLKKKKLSDSSNDNFHYLFNNGKCSDYDNDKISDIIECIINFICYIEKNGMDTMIYTKKLWHNNFKDREDNIMAVELMINFYCDVIKYIANKKIDFYCDKISDVCNIANSNSIESVAKKIEILDNVKNNLKKNLNINLVIDKMIIDMCGDY